MPRKTNITIQLQFDLPEKATPAMVQPFIRDALRVGQVGTELNKVYGPLAKGLKMEEVSMKLIKKEISYA